MQVKGAYIVDLPIEKVWQYILDRAILEEVTPGVSQLIELQHNEYEATSEIKLGPVKGSFKGRLKVHDVLKPESFILSLTQNSNMGSAQADITVQLKSLSTQTEVDYHGIATLTGVVGRLGQRVLGGVVNSLAKQFFGDFEKKVKAIG